MHKLVKNLLQYIAGAYNSCARPTPRRNSVYADNNNLFIINNLTFDLTGNNAEIKTAIKTVKTS